jgi:MinD-like ATPase involved in chromosome partitioning or flagellar assembly/CheY-like chemotaxis protein
LEWVLNKCRILIIDADEASRNLLEYSLDKIGHYVVTAPTGKEGLIIAWHERPDILVIDPNLDDIAITEIILKLRKDRRTRRKTLIAFSSLTDNILSQIVKKLDFDYFLQKGGDAVPDLMAIIENASNDRDITTHSTYSPGADLGKLIVFASAKGGTGTSTLCVNTASVIARNFPENRVAVVDGVLPIGSIAHLVGYAGREDLVSITSLIQTSITVDYLYENLNNSGVWGFHLLAGSSNPEDSTALNVDRIPYLLNKLQLVYDYIFIDLGRTLSRVSLPIMLKADQFVMVLSPDWSTISSTKIVWDYLQSIGLIKTQVYSILNHPVGIEGRPIHDIEELLDMRINAKIPYMKRSFSEASNQNKPLSELYPNERTTDAIYQAAMGIADRIQNKELKIIAI